MQGSKRPSLCYVQPCVVAMKQHLESFSDSIVANSTEIINTRFTNLMKDALDDIHFVATFLHPLLKNTSSFALDDVQRAHNKVLNRSI